MIIAPLQSWGLGDIIYCQTLANDWLKQGHKVVWGVKDVFVEGLQRAYPNITFVDWKTLPIDYNRQDEHDCGIYRVIPLRWNVEILGVPYSQCMSSKYSLFGEDWTRWREHAMWQRTPEKESELLQLLGIAPGDKYNLISDTYGSDMKLKVPITVNNNYKNVYLKHIPGFSLFDWAPVFEYATTIHVVSSSNIYLMEMLDLKAEEVKLYLRRPIESNHDNYSYILQRHNYILE